MAGDLSVDLKALHSDAKVWKTAATETATPASDAARQLTLTDGGLSYLAQNQGDGVDFVAAYEAVRAEVERLLAEGAAQMNNLSNQLTEAADGYNSNDHHTRARIRKTWNRIGNK
jgi:hypothetical protein